MDMLKKTYETLHVKESEKIKSVAYSTSAKENNRPQTWRERKMYKVYSRYVKTGKINYLNVLPVSALDLGKLTLTVQPVDYVSALAGIAKPVSKTYAANERYAVAATVQVPQYYDVTNLQIIGEPTNLTVNWTQSITLQNVTVLTKN